MTITHILVFAFAAIPVMWLIPSPWRPWGLFIGSLLGMTWLQDSNLRDGVDVALPLATVILTVAVWWIVQPKPLNHPSKTPHDQWAFILMVACFGIFIAINAVLANPFNLAVMVASIGLVTVTGIGISQLLPRENTTTDSLTVYKQMALWMIVIIILGLAVIKIPTVARLIGGLLASEKIQDFSAASAFVWLGYSYIAFRLMAILFDFRAGRLPKEGFALRDMATYVLFFPAFTAGPIDRSQRFILEMNQTLPLDAARVVEGGTRIAVGIVKKFIIADSLALVAMNPTLIDRTQSMIGLWLILYLYTFQIFFDFSGYSDVAIGLGKLYGINLPENFDRPYLQQNIQQFWQRWHITLSTWFRLYYFTPFSRMLMKSRYKIPQQLIIFIAQLSTMILIGVWHGATLNFILWGVWHGVGLYLHKLLADNTRAWYRRVSEVRWVKRGIYVSGVVATFHFVALGWVFFALATPTESFEMLQRLFGG